MARLRLGIAGVLLFVLAASGFGLGGTPAAGIERGAVQAEETGFDPLRNQAETTSVLVSISIDDSDDDLRADDSTSAPRPADGLARAAAAAAAGTRPSLPPRATGPPASSIV